MDEDISRLKTTAVGLLSDLGCNESTLTLDLIDLSNEMCQFGAAELRGVAAWVGEIASQEVIKLKTGNRSYCDRISIRNLSEMVCCVGAPMGSSKARGNGISIRNLSEMVCCVGAPIGSRKAQGSLSS
ncbi:hypothetical protein FNV43_RR25153 [Rhamnella rubrinervis]|uniref:Uncharacterized protein n=1 Tax=Rhamnella rubrinervis TaxID=2594499 RepID=A0A8K0GTV9_9ROSA|nr:hypothetical protein FNV43_RR25153 [Rhamnella rubrinervis]